MLIERPKSTDEAIKLLFEIASGFEYQEQLSSLTTSEIDDCGNILKRKIDNFIYLENINPNRHNDKQRLARGK